MVTDATMDGGRVWACEVCGLAFDDRDLAARCEDHCRTHDSCDLAIGRKAVGSVGGDVRDLG